jgi:hypothetical protein
MPWLSVLVGYFFIIEESDLSGLLLLLELQFWVILLFTLGYTLVISGSQRTPIRLTKMRLTQKSRMVIRGFVIFGVIAGLAAFFWLYKSIGMAWGTDYAQIGLALRGSGWIIRLGELLPLAGLLLIVQGRIEGRRKIILLGLTLILLFAILRLPFQNRENVVRYFLIAVFYYQISTDKKIRSTRIAAFFFTIVCAVFLLPILSLMRGGNSLSQITDLYNFFVFRDLNFSEVVSALFTQDQFQGKVGIAGGIENIAASLVPRDIWPDKPYPLAVLITSWVTQYPSYDFDDPTFAYAPSFLGVLYVMQGIPLILLFTLLWAITTGLLIRWARSPTDLGKSHLRLLLVGAFINYWVFAIQKLDFGSVIPATIISFSYLFLAYWIIPFRYPKKTRERR